MDQIEGWQAELDELLGRMHGVFASGVGLARLDHQTAL